MKLQNSIFDGLRPTLQDLEKLSLLSHAKAAEEDRMLCSVTDGLIHYLLSLYVKQQNDRSNTVPAWLYEIAQELRRPENFSRRVGDIISLSNYSHSQFYKKFKKYTGMNLIEYVVNVRLEYAADLLMRTERSVIDIASAVGYDSVSFFIKAFHKKYGMTPTRFKKTVQQSNPPRIKMP